MKPKSMLLLVVAGACGLVAAIVITQHLTGSAPVAEQVEAKKKVVVAASDQMPGVLLKADMLKVVEMAPASIPEGTFSDPAELTGQMLRLPIFKGELVLSGKVGEKSGLAAIPRGMVLASIRIDEEAGALRGLINPGDHVNVAWLPQNRTDVHSTSVVPLLQDVKVVAVGGRTDAIESESSRQANVSGGESYSLLVNDIQNLRLAAATGSGRGKLRLSLRSKDDSSLQTIDEEALDILLGLKQPRLEKPPEPIVVQPPPPPPPEPAKYTVDYIVKGDVTTKSYEIADPTKPIHSQD